MQKIPSLTTTAQALRIKKIILVAVVLAIWLIVFWRAIHVFAPGTLLGSFSSDEAIPVLMSNDDRPITLFNLYYYGAGRWGGWPFLFAQLLRRASGFRWTDQRLFVVQTAWVFLGALVIGALASEEWATSGLVYLLTICLNPGVSMRVFTLSQVYGWQIPSLLLAWYGLRRLLEDRHIAKQNQLVLNRMTWGAVTLWFSFLSIWSSLASIPILFFLGSLEGLKAYHAGDARRTRQRLRQPIIALLIVGLATLFEWLMRMNYYRHNFKHYQFDYRWQVALDSGYLMQNLRVQAEHLWMYPWWRGFYLIALSLLVALAFALLYLYSRNKARACKRFREALKDDTLILIVGSFGIAVINFIAIVLADHVRINLYDNRFMTLTYLFASISGILSLFLFLKRAAQRWTLRPMATRAGFVLVGLVVLLLDFPPQTHNESYDRVKDIALTLEQKMPHAVLLGGYWETYIFVAQQSENAMTPVPLEGIRTPWTPEALRTSNFAVMEHGHRHFPVPQTLTKYETTLKLVEQKWYENGEYAFALYVNESK